MTLVRIDTRSLDAGPDEVTVICPVRDEMVLLPHFLRHHRRVGVGRFIFVDNGSTDGTADFLAAQPDVVLYRTEDGFRDANYGMDWITALAQQHCRERWIVYVDCDEHLVYPGCEEVPIGAYCRSLSDAGYDCAFAVMVDLYPDGSFRDVRLTAEGNILDALSYFDTDYVFRRWPLPPWARAGQFPLQILGGPRCRLVSRLAVEESRGWVSTFLYNKIDRFVYGVPEQALPYLFRLWPPDLPALQKKPLNFVRDGFAYTNSHSSTNSAVAPTLNALLHFKFCDDLARRMRPDFAKANHYRRGMAYMQLKDALERLPDYRLVYEGSRVYRGSADLAAVGLIGESVSALWSDPAATKVRTSPAGPQILRRNAA